MTIQDIVRKFMHKDEDFRDMQRQDKMVRVLEARKKNSNERELERFLEEQRQKEIKEQLEKFRQQKRDEFWHGPNILDQKKLFVHHPGDKSVLHQDFNVMTGGKKLFMKKGNSLNSKGGF